MSLSIFDIVGYIPANNNCIFSPTDFSASATSGIAAVTTPWGYEHASITSASARPDASSGQMLVEDSSNNKHRVLAFGGVGALALVGFPSNVLYRFAFLVKPAGRTRVVAGIDCFDNGLSIGSIRAVTACFDLDGLTVVDNTADAGFWTFVGGDVTAVPGEPGWVLCTLDGFFSTAPSNNYNFYKPWIALDDGTGGDPRSITYTGDGSSGVEIWWASLLPKGAWALDTQTFRDDFDDISTIDVNDTRADGFNWYVHNLFPNTSCVDFGTVTNPPSAPTPAANISVAASKVTLTPSDTDPNPGYMTQIWSVAYTGDMGGGPTGYKGRVYALPVMFEASFEFDAAHLDTEVHAGFIAFWGLAIEGLTGTENQFVEVDFAEAAASTNANAAIHMWTGPSFATDHEAGGIGPFGGTVFDPALTAADYANQHRYTCVVLDAASNGGWGVAVFFFDGLFTGGFQTWSATEQANPGLSGANLPGALSMLDHQHLPIIFNTPGNFPGEAPIPMGIDWVQVYEVAGVIPPSECALTQEDGFRFILADGSGALVLEVCDDVPPSECALTQEDGFRFILADGSGALVLEICDSVCALTQEDGYRFILADNSGALVLEVCEPPPSDCALTQEDGFRFLLADLSGALVLEVCDDVPSIAAAGECFLDQEDGFQFSLEDGSGFLALEVCDDVIFHGGNIRSWREYLRPHRSQIRDEDREEAEREIRKASTLEAAVEIAASVETEDEHPVVDLLLEMIEARRLRDLDLLRLQERLLEQLLLGWQAAAAAEEDAILALLLSYP